MLKQPGRFKKKNRGDDFNYLSQPFLTSTSVDNHQPLWNSQGLLYRLFSHASSLDLGLEASMDFGVGKN